MAITEWFECTISIDGAVAREYDVPEDENGGTLPNEVTKYIEAKSGANFLVEFKIKSLWQIIDGRQIVDGRSSDCWDGEP